MPSILPTEEQLTELSRIPDGAPLVMVNLLRFKPDGGAASYDTYSRKVMPILERIGARVLYFGTDTKTFIGDDGWDAVLLVEYPSRSAFVAMISDKSYLEAGRYRTEGLIDSRLYITRPVLSR